MLVKEVVITTAVRTPIGSFGGAFKTVSAVQLGKVVVEALLEKSGVKPEQIDEVIFGNVLHAGLGQNVARQVAITAGIPNDKPAFTVDELLQKLVSNPEKLQGLTMDKTLDEEIAQAKEQIVMTEPSAVKAKEVTL